MPAAKYSSLVSRLMLTSGITAIDRVVLTAGAAAVAGGDDVRRLVNHAPPAATDARIPAPASAHTTRFGRGAFGMPTRGAETKVPLTTAGSSSARTTSPAARGRFAGSFSSSRMTSDA